jgi:hypothetical protein
MVDGRRGKPVSRVEFSSVAQGFSPAVSSLFQSLEQDDVIGDD